MKPDQIMKKAIYTDKIMSNFIAQGVYPSYDEITEALNAINLSESLFRVVPVVSGSLFNPAIYNSQAITLEKDLQIIYQLLKKYSEEEYNKLVQFADTTLTELEDKVAFYLEKSRMEMSSSHLGKTLYFLKAPFTGEQENDYFKINCGSIDFVEGSQISLLIEGNNIRYARLKLENESYTFYVTPYSLNMQSFLMPGEATINEIAVEVLDTPKVNEAVMMPYEPKAACDYVILAGEGAVSIKTASSMSTENYSKIICHEESMIDFYVKDAVSIQIRTNTAPLKTNYDQTYDVIKLTQSITHFYLKMPANSIVDIYMESGKIYSTKSSGITNENKLYAFNALDFKHYLIIEKCYEKRMTYKATLEIEGTIESLGIESLMIKEVIV